MSSKELRRAGVLARVVSGELKLVNGAVMMGLSYRQSKRLGQRYREEGAEGLKHRSAGRESNRKKPKKFRQRVLRLVAKKYSGEEGERFGDQRNIRRDDESAIMNGLQNSATHPGIQNDESGRRWITVKQGLGGF